MFNKRHKASHSPFMWRHSRSWQELMGAGLSPQAFLVTLRGSCPLLPRRTWDLCVGWPWLAELTQPTNGPCESLWAFHWLMLDTRWGPWREGSISTCDGVGGKVRKAFSLEVTSKSWAERHKWVILNDTEWPWSLPSFSFLPSVLLTAWTFFPRENSHLSLSQALPLAFLLPSA